MNHCRLFTALLVVLRCHFMAGDILASIYWSTTNPIFLGEDVYTVNVLLSQRMNIICPVQGIVLSTIDNQLSTDNLYENFIAVDKHGFDTCTYNATNPNHKMLLQCNNQKSTDTIQSHTMVFIPFSADPNRMTFDQGKDYYFIATSNGTKESLNAKSGGHCNGKNIRMKFKVHVCRSSEDCENRNKNQTNCFPSTGTVPRTTIAPDTANPTGGSRTSDTGGTTSSTGSWMAVAIILVILILIMLGLGGFFLWKFSKGMKKNTQSSKEVAQAVKDIKEYRESQLLDSLSQGSFLHDMRSVSMYVSDPNMHTNNTMNGSLRKQQSPRPVSMITTPTHYYSGVGGGGGGVSGRESQYTTVESDAGLLPYTSPTGMEV